MNNTSNVQDKPDIIPKVEITPKEITPEEITPEEITPLQIIKEDKSVTDNTSQEPKSHRKEMVAVKNEEDIDETS